MGYKLKPKKAVSKRFKLTAKGKLKRRHTLTSHLRSSRSAKKKRQLGRPAIMTENMAKNMRRLMGVDGKHPNANKRKVSKPAAKAAAAA